MTIESVTCAECGDPVGLDVDHEHVIVESKRIADRDNRDDYYLYVRCAEKLTTDWFAPA